jgi:hypothetical protein
VSLDAPARGRPSRDRPHGGERPWAHCAAQSHDQ